MRLTSQVSGERPPRTTIVGGMPLSPRLHALTTLPGPASILLFTLLLLFCATPIMATAHRPQGIPPKQTWRVINDAPYRVVPAYSPLKKPGKPWKSWVLSQPMRCFPASKSVLHLTPWPSAPMGACWPPAPGTGR
jgi:hypothetical protein